MHYCYTIVNESRNTKFSGTRNTTIHATIRSPSRAHNCARYIFCTSQACVDHRELLESRCRSLEDEIVDLHQQLEKQRNAHWQLQQQNDEQINECFAIEHQHDDLMHKMNQLQEKNRMLQEQLNRTTKMMARRSSGGSTCDSGDFLLSV